MAQLSRKLGFTWNRDLIAARFWLEGFKLWLRGIALTLKEWELNLRRRIRRWRHDRPPESLDLETVKVGSQVLNEWLNRESRLTAEERCLIRFYGTLSVSSKSVRDTDTFRRAEVVNRKVYEEGFTPEQITAASMLCQFNSAREPATETIEERLEILRDDWRICHSPGEEFPEKEMRAFLLKKAGEKLIDFGPEATQRAIENLRRAMKKKKGHGPAAAAALQEALRAVGIEDPRHKKDDPKG